MKLGYQTSLIFISVKMEALIPICANPLATDANPKFQLHLIFQAVIKNIPLSPDRGDAVGAGIIIDYLLNKLITK
jgi:hypothetical protein